MSPAHMVHSRDPGVAGTAAVVTRREGEVAPPADLIVWPESPAPLSERDQRFGRGMSSLARATRVPVIVDDIAWPRMDAAAQVDLYALRNAVVCDRGRELAGRYDKMHLVPFGEYVPFKRMFFFAGS